MKKNVQIPCCILLAISHSTYIYNSEDVTIYYNCIKAYNLMVYTHTGGIYNRRTGEGEQRKLIHYINNGLQLTVHIQVDYSCPTSCYCSHIYCIRSTVSTFNILYYKARCSITRFNINRNSAILYSNSIFSYSNITTYWKWITSYS